MAKLLMEEPVCLIENNKGHLRVVPEALEILKRIDQCVVVVAVVGLYRTGKSYLLNQLAGKKRKFAMATCINSQTKGIWMWCVTHPTKVNHILVLLDTEGMGDVEKGDAENDNWIFTLAVLLSSTLVYNSLKAIDNNALEQLHYVTELTKHIKLKSNTSEAEDEEIPIEFMHFFPSFVWALRDFTLKLEYDGKPITADEYLRNSLKQKSGHGKQVMEYNMVRNCIRNYFPTRKCFVFDPPTTPENMARLDRMKKKAIHPTFISQARDFCDYIYEEAKTKTMKGGYPVTGNMLGNLAEMYVDVICDGKIPCLENAVVSLAEIQNSKAIDESVNFYEKNMSKVALPTETQDELSLMHNKTQKQAVKIFMRLCFKDEDLTNQFHLMEQIRAAYTEICKKNVTESKKACESIIKVIFKSLEENIASVKYIAAGGHKQYQEDLANGIAEYRSAKGKGITDEKCLTEYLDKNKPVGKNILAADESLTEAQRKEEENRVLIENMRQLVRAREKYEKDLQMQLEDMEQIFQDNMKKRKKKMEEIRNCAAKEFSQLLEHLKQEEEELKEANDL